MSLESFPSKPQRSIPWGLVFTLSLISSAGAWFYRTSRSHSEEKALIKRLRSQLVLSPDEVVQARDANRLTVAHFTELARRSASAPPLSFSTYLMHYIPDQLGGEFQAKQSLHAGHLFQRLASALDGSAAPPTLLTQVLCLCLAVKAEPPNKLLQAMYEFAAANQPSMSRAQFEQVLEGLMRTDQLPVRVLVREIDEYPFRRYVPCSPSELASKAQVPDSVSSEEFARILLSRDVCVWGQCSTPRG